MDCRCEAVLKNYLEAVAVWLPAAQRDDIATELAEDLRSKIEDREAASGRPVSEDELVKILKQRGHPLSVAGRYSPQRYLIGPAWFPFYRFMVKLVVLWIQLPLFALIIGPLKAFGSGHPLSAVIETAGAYVTAAMIACVCLTIVFAALERYPFKTAQNWDPRRRSGFTIVKAILDTDTKMCARGVAQAVSSLVFALGWQYVAMHWQGFGFGIAGTNVAPILEAVYWPIMLALIAGIAQGVVELLLPARTELRAGIRIASALLSLVAVFALFKMRAIEQIWGPSGPAGQWMHIGFQLPLLIVAAAVVADAAKELWRIRRAAVKHNWAMPAAARK